MADPNERTRTARPFGRAHLGAPTGSEAAAFDRDAIDRVGVPQSVLMENAGRSAAQILQRLHPRGTVVGLVGAGNNGGDALVALRTLAAWGRPVRAVRVSDTPATGLLHGWDVPWASDGAPLDAILADASVLVDGILGTGIRGAPRPPQALAIEALNRASTPVVALDLPSGVDAATGATPGPAVRAHCTVAFGWPKLGGLVPPGRELAGRLIAVEIGFPRSSDAFGASVLTPAWAHAHLPRREAETHKYAVGTLLLVAGGDGMAGAAVMAGRAAQRSGLGLLRVAAAPENREILQATVPEAVFVDLSDPGAVADAVAGAAALAVGPGLGRDQRARNALAVALEADEALPVVLDADALTLLGQGAGPSIDALARTRPVVVTPHTGELERITDFRRDQVAADRVGVAREVAARLGAVTLLKGLPSVVAEPGGHVRVDVVGTSDLATGGMGDVLTGVVGSFLAQGSEAGVAAGLGLVVSGRAAVRAHRGAGLVPDDVIEALPDAMAEEGEGGSDLQLPFVVFDRDPPR